MEASYLLACFLHCNHDTKDRASYSDSTFITVSRCPLPPSAALPGRSTLRIALLQYLRGRPTLPPLSAYPAAYATYRIQHPSFTLRPYTLGHKA